MAHKFNDLIGKSIIEEHTINILRFFIPGADNIFDFSKKIEFLESELPDLNPDADTIQDSLHADKVLKVSLLSGDLAWVLINIEVQGYKEDNFSERVFKYFYRLLDKYGKRIAVITIYTDSNNDFNQDSFNYSLLGTKLAFGFTTYKVLNQKESELLNHPNPVALIMLALLIVLQNEKKKDKNAVLERGINLVKSINERDFDENQKANLLKIIQLYFNFKVPEIRAKFDKAIESFTQKTEPMGIFELDKFIAVEEAKEKGIELGLKQGREQGIDIGQRKKDIIFVTNLLTNTDFSTEKISSLAQVTIKFVKEIQVTLLHNN